MPGAENDLNCITAKIVDAAYRLHVGLGPGLLESVYEIVLARDLLRRGLRVSRQKAVSFEYEGLRFTDCFRLRRVINSPQRL